MYDCTYIRISIVLSFGVPLCINAGCSAFLLSLVLLGHHIRLINYSREPLRTTPLILYALLCPQNTVHVTIMYHVIIIDLHALHNMHVVMLMYMNVSCNMHEFQTFRTFSMHVTCKQYDYKHQYNMHVIWETKT